MIKDVVVSIQDSLTGIDQAGFGIPLIFDNTTDSDYQEITEISEIADFTSGDIAYDMAEAIFAQNPVVEKVALYGVDVASAGSSITDELDDLVLNNNSWYFLLLANRTEADQEEAASWVDSNEKFGVYQADKDTDVSTIVASAATMASARNLIIAHDGGSSDTEQYADARLVGIVAPKDPGSLTWKFKTLSGLEGTSFTTTEISNLHDGNVITYISKLGVLQTSEAYTTDGTYADITRSKDYLQARIEEEVSSLLYNNDKIPYTSDGIAQVGQVLQGVLKRAVNTGIIAEDEDGIGLWEVILPDIDDISDTNKTNRILPDIEFTATIAGAVHKVEISGVLEV